jgi:hypothetical protein
VDGCPVRVFSRTGRPCFVNRISWSCFGESEVERLACGRVGFLLELDEPLGDLAALLAQALAVDQHAVMLHLEQHRHERLLDLLVDAKQPGLLSELRVQRLVQLQRDVRVLGGVLGRLVDGHLVERDLLRALAGDVLVLMVSTPR